MREQVAVLGEIEGTLRRLEQASADAQLLMLSELIRIAREQVLDDLRTLNDRNSIACTTEIAAMREQGQLMSELLNKRRPAVPAARSGGNVLVASHGGSRNAFHRRDQ